jgi:hypothetical protein
MPGDSRPNQVQAFRDLSACETITAQAQDHRHPRRGELEGSSLPSGERGSIGDLVLGVEFPPEDVDLAALEFGRKVTGAVGQTVGS